MDSYLSNCTQVVYLEGFTSPTLHTGPRSVVQGSGLSCILYLVYTMDLPLIFEGGKLTVAQSEDSQWPDSITYVDDNIVTVSKMDNEDLQVTLLKTIQLVEQYMSANLLLLNPEKTKMMVLTKHPARRSQYKIPATPKDITHSKHLRILGSRHFTQSRLEILPIGWKGSYLQAAHHQGQCPESTKENYLHTNPQTPCEWYFHVQTLVWGRSLGWRAQILAE